MTARTTRSSGDPAAVGTSGSSVSARALCFMEATSSRTCQPPSGGVAAEMRRAQRSQGPKGRTPKRSEGVDGASTSLTIEALAPGRSSERRWTSEAGADACWPRASPLSNQELGRASKAVVPSAGRSCCCSVPHGRTRPAGELRRPVMSGRRQAARFVVAASVLPIRSRALARCLGGSTSP